MHSILKLFRRVLQILACVALASCSTTDRGVSRVIVATIDHSEWRDPTLLRIDLATGRYGVAPGSFPEPQYGSRTWSRKTFGRLPPRKLGNLNELFDRVRATGLVDQQCASLARNQREVIVITNGGTPRLQLRINGILMRQHPDLECWTQEANNLHDALDATMISEWEERTGETC